MGRRSPRTRARELARDIPGWMFSSDKPGLQREYKVPDFATAMNFVGRVAEIAQKEGHHPDFHLHYNRVTLVFWTHAIGGLSENDFIVAAKINALQSSRAA